MCFITNMLTIKALKKNIYSPFKLYFYYYDFFLCSSNMLKVNKRIH